MGLFVENASRMSRVTARLAESIFAWTVSTRSVLINHLRSVGSVIIGIVLIVCMKASLTVVMVSVVMMGRICGGEMDDYRDVARVV